MYNFIIYFKIHNELNKTRFSKKKKKKKKKKKRIKPNLFLLFLLCKTEKEEPIRVKDKRFSGLLTQFVAKEECF